jgi:hypothetical protein
VRAIRRADGSGSNGQVAYRGVLTMQAQMTGRVLAGACLCVLWVASVEADIISISGSATAIVQEFRQGEAARTAEASQVYPDTSTQLPLQVVARLRADQPETAAAAVAAQFAGPRDLNQPNPQEFAIDLALLSVSKSICYASQASTQEIRGIELRAADFPGHFAGQTVPLIGRLYVDAVLAVFSPAAGKDLTGARVFLRVTVVKQESGRADETVFSGRVGLEGGPGATVQQVAEGDFPTGTLIRSNLAAYLEEFARFEVLILPRLTISYDYQAVLGQPFTLRATVEVEAANAEDEVGVAALIGTPLDSIREVIAAAQGEAVAAKTVTALENERASPTGVPAFPPPPARQTLPFCGLFGFEALLGLSALAGLRMGRRRGHLPGSMRK